MEVAKKEPNETETFSEVMVLQGPTCKDTKLATDKNTPLEQA